MKIEFDPAKRHITLEHRGLDMAQAGEIFEDTTLTIADTRKDYGERRFITFRWLTGRMVVLVWTPRVAGRRIISLRKANDREQALYRHRLD